MAHIAGDGSYSEIPPSVSHPLASPAALATVRVGVGAGAPVGLNRGQATGKRAFDVAAAVIGIVLLSPVILLAFLAASIDTHASGFFRQDRVGLHGRRFRLVKIRSMRVDPAVTTSVTTSNDPRITRFGRFFRRSKVDELPQLWNVLRGQMSLVGPRPEVPGFADLLTGRDAFILEIRPGITGPATLHFRDEERLLAASDDPEAYNRDVLFPAKVRMNLEYLQNYSFRGDLRYLWRTLR